tara:strand:+ start:2235 stop:3287 length:1053 start_codon:yes stop_codon:yes gene_type:complete
MNHERYQRQMLIPEIGADGQARLSKARVLVAGCGALGCTIADLLARAGVGHLRIVDRDLVELTNLQRQVLFTESDVGAPKAFAAARRLEAVNSDIEIEPHTKDINPSTVRKLAADCDLIVDGLDNFETRYLLNDMAISCGIPYIYGGAVGSEGLSFTVLGDGAADGSPCLRCLFPEPPEPGTTATCDTAGVLGPLISMVGAHEALQAMKLILGKRDEVDRTLMRIDVWNNSIHRMDASRPVPDCPCCAKRDFQWLSGNRSSSMTVLCGQDAVQVLPAMETSVDIEDLSRRLAPYGQFDVHDGIIRGRLHEERGGSGNPVELTVFEDLRALVGGVDSAERARAIYDRYIGS